MNCDINHQLISFAGDSCPVCRIRDIVNATFDKFEKMLDSLQGICKIHKRTAFSTKKPVKKSKTKGKSKGKLIVMQPRKSFAAYGPPPPSGGAA
jgi:hypothetical protein